MGEGSQAPDPFDGHPYGAMDVGGRRYTAHELLAMDAESLDQLREQALAEASGRVGGVGGVGGRVSPLDQPGVTVVSTEAEAGDPEAEPQGSFQATLSFSIRGVGGDAEVEKARAYIERRMRTVLHEPVVVRVASIVPDPLTRGGSAFDNDASL